MEILKKKYLYLQFCILVSCSAYAQNQNAKWFFGKYAGIDFSTNPPTVLTGGQTNCTEGVTGIADNSGNLLFYTDGETIWNASHVTMANGTGLLGHQSS